MNAYGISKVVSEITDATMEFVMTSTHEGMLFLQQFFNAHTHLLALLELKL